MRYHDDSQTPGAPTLTIPVGSTVTSVAQPDGGRGVVVGAMLIGKRHPGYVLQIDRADGGGVYHAAIGVCRVSA